MKDYLPYLIRVIGMLLGILAALRAILELVDRLLCEDPYPDVRHREFR